MVLIKSMNYSGIRPATAIIISNVTFAFFIFYPPKLLRVTFISKKVYHFFLR